jgi:hypothetical protein
MALIDQHQSTTNHQLTKEEARAIVAPLYEALNEPLKKDVSVLLAQATNPDYRSCSTLTDCLDREGLAEIFKAMGKMVPNLRWTIQDVWATEDTLRDVVTGLIKSVVFATIIAHVGCLEGFRVRGGPDSVGRSTTSAVVKSTFLVIVADAVFTAIFYFTVKP